jgi:glycosyltransferase involved in cell wall biosynthesis
VTVVRNGAATIEKTIRSVLGQQGEPVEYIIVDGDSTDGTLEIIRRYEDRIALWVSEPDAGIADAFNKGISLARGELIGLVNSDDEYAPDAIASGLAALDTHPEAGFSFGDCAFLQDDRQVMVFRADADYARVIGRRMPRVNHPSFLMRRSVYEQRGLFRTQYRIAMDYDFFLRIHRAGVRGAAIPKVLVRMRLGGISNAQVLRCYRECFEVARNNGEPIVPAAAELIASSAGHLIKRGLIRIGADTVVRRLETLRYGGLDG